MNTTYFLSNKKILNRIGIIVGCILAILIILFVHHSKIVREEQTKALCQEFKSMDTISGKKSLNDMFYDMEKLVAKMDDILYRFPSAEPELIDSINQYKAFSSDLKGLMKKGLELKNAKWITVMDFFIRSTTGMFNLLRGNLVGEKQIDNGKQMLKAHNEEVIDLVSQIKQREIKEKSLETLFKQVNSTLHEKYHITECLRYAL